MGTTTHEFRSAMKKALSSMKPRPTFIFVEDVWLAYFTYSSMAAEAAIAMRAMTA